MPVATIGTHEVDVNEEGFLTNPDQWDEDLAKTLAANIGIELTDAHWRAIRFAREDYKETGESPTIRRLNKTGGVPTKELFQLFPKKPAKKVAYIAGLPKPVGCV
jgi:TusE/DsrC/DsvC family sulfur relay protein